MAKSCFLRRIYKRKENNKMARKMTISEKQQVIAFEKRERFALQNLVNIWRQKHPEFEYLMMPSGLDTDAFYDAYLVIKEKDSNEIIDSFVIEMKNRTSIYEEMYLEVKKLNQLKKTVKDFNTSNRVSKMLYINCTPQNTLLFFLDDIDLKKTKNIEMRAESFAIDQKKRNKKVYSLNIKEAVKNKYIYCEQEYQKSLEVVKIETVAVKQRVKYYESLF